MYVVITVLTPNKNKNYLFSRTETNGKISKLSGYSNVLKGKHQYNIYSIG